MRYYLILLFTVKLLSQDYLVTLSGNQAQGKYIDIDDTHLHFQQKGSNVVSKIPIASLIRVVLSDGTVIYEQGQLVQEYKNKLEKQSIQDSKRALMMGRIIGNKSSKKYHHGYVGHLPDEENRLTFLTVKDAELKNYEPCNACFDTRPALTDYYLEKEISMVTNSSIRSRYEVIYEHKDLDHANKIMEKVLGKWVDDLKGYDYRILIIRDDTPNAFAVAGGNIYLTTGIIKMFEDEIELEFVIAHEITHIERRHSLRQYKEAQRMKLITGFLTVFAGAGVAAAGGDISNIRDVMNTVDAISKFGELLATKGYSRELEQEADIYAQVYASKNDMDKLKLTYALDKLATRSERLGQELSANAFSDHPGLKSRINQIVNSELIELDESVEISAELDMSAGKKPNNNSLIGGKDILVTISGKQSWGVFKEIIEDKVVFHGNGSTFPSKIPKNVVSQVILSDGTVVFGDGAEEVKKELPKEDHRLLSFNTKYVFIGPSSNKSDNHIVTLIGEASNHSFTKDLKVKDFYIQDFSIDNKIIKFANMKSFAIESGNKMGFASNIEIKSNKVSNFMDKLKNKKLITILKIEEVKIKPGVGAKKEAAFTTIPTITSIH